MTPKGVVVAHRAPMVAEGIAAALHRYPSIVSLGIATTGPEAEERGARADAVVLDQYLAGADVVTRRLRARGVRVVILGDPVEGDDEPDLRVSVRGSIAALAEALVPDAGEAPGRGRLTPRELEILHLVARGMAGKQVARHLGISPKTVEQHKARIFTKLGVRNQTAAVSLVLGLGRAG